MKKFAVLAFVASCAMAQSKGKSVFFYTTADGSRVQASEAILASVKGDEIYKCTQVQATVSKAGTSIGLKAKKVPQNNQ